MRLRQNSYYMSYEFLPIRLKNEEENRKPVFVSFGAGAHTVHYEGGSSRLHGYKTPENFFHPSKWWAHDYKQVENQRLFEGIPWLDMTHLADTKEGRERSISGPMVDVGCFPGERRGSRGVELSCRLREELRAGFLEQVCYFMENPQEPAGSFTMVSMEEHCAAWKLLGAHAGVIRSGRFAEMDEPPPGQAHYCEDLVRRW